MKLYGIEYTSKMSGYTAVYTLPNKKQLKACADEIDRIFKDCINYDGVEPFDIDAVNDAQNTFLRRTGIILYDECNYSSNRNIRRDISELYNDDDTLRCELIASYAWRF